MKKPDPVALRRHKRKKRKSRTKVKVETPADILAANLTVQANDVLAAWRAYQEERQYVPPPTKGWAGFKHRHAQRKERFYARVTKVRALRGCVTLYKRWKEMNKPKRSTEGYRVDETGPEFPASLMDRASFMQLSLWARTHNVTQPELYGLYETYRSHLAMKTHPDESRKLPNRVSLLYFQDLFDHGMSEAASLVLLPTLFVKETHGLAKAKVNFEIDFVRFVIAGYAFARCSPAGVVLKFFRLLLDYHMCNEQVYITLRPFEELVALIHGGINRPLLVLFHEAFGKRTHVRFVEMVRACVAMPPLLYPLFVFHRHFKRKFFNNHFWARHALPCMDPSEEDLFTHLLIPPAMERSLDGARCLEDAWRLAARRVFGWVRMPMTDASEYWLELKCDDCRDLDDEPPDETVVAHHTAALRQHFGFRFGKFVATLAFDARPLAPGALPASTWALFEEPLRSCLEPGGADLDCTATTTATPRRRPVREWPNPVAEDPHVLKGPDSFYHKQPADVLRHGWTTLRDPQSGADFYYHAPTGESQWLDPRYDYLVSGWEGRKSCFSESRRRDAIDKGKIVIPGVTDVDPDTGLPSGEDHLHVGGHRGAAVFHRRPEGKQAGDRSDDVKNPLADDASSVNSNLSSRSGVSSLASGGGPGQANTKLDVKKKGAMAVLSAAGALRK